MKRTVAVAVTMAALVPATAFAQGINTNVALPVAKGAGIWRSQVRYVQATDDPTPQDREVRAILTPQTLVLGFTPRLTAFATLPVLVHRSRDEAGRSAQHDSALGDLRLLGRYTFFADDYAPLATRRVAVLGGVKFPTGDNHFGTPSFDPILGAVGTWAHDRHEIDLDVLYRIGTERHDFETGDTLRYDLAYRYRLWPRRFAGRLLQVNGLLELNGTRQAKSRDEGDRLSDTGGSLLFLSPGFQIISTRWIVEASVQIPVHQEMNGSQVKTDVIAVLGVRVPFYVAW